MQVGDNHISLPDKSLQVYYCKIDPNIPAQSWNSLRSRLTISQQQRNDRFVHFEDKQRNLFGLLLLRMHGRQYRDMQLAWSELQFDEHNRPFLPDTAVDFNISHSGAYVVSAFSAIHRLGIDVEFKKSVTLEDFQYTMNDSQWAEIMAATDPFDKFFEYWTIKESVIKADGRGLSIPLTDIIIEDGKVNYDGHTWFLYPLQFDDHHKCCLAADQEGITPQLREVHWREFLP